MTSYHTSCMIHFRNMMGYDMVPDFFHFYIMKIKNHLSFYNRSDAAPLTAGP